MFPSQNKEYIILNDGKVTIAEKMPVNYAIFNKNMTRIDELDEDKIIKVNSFIYRYEYNGDLFTIPQESVKMIPKYVVDRLIAEII